MRSGTRWSQSRLFREHTIHPQRHTFVLPHPPTAGGGGGKEIRDICTSFLDAAGSQNHTQRLRLKEYHRGHITFPPTPPQSTTTPPPGTSESASPNRRPPRQWGTLNGQSTLPPQSLQQTSPRWGGVLPRFIGDCVGSNDVVHKGCSDGLCGLLDALDGREQTSFLHHSGVLQRAVGDGVGRNDVVYKGRRYRRRLSIGLPLRQYCCTTRVNGRGHGYVGTANMSSRTSVV